MKATTWLNFLYELFEGGVKVRGNIQVSDANLLMEIDVNELDLNAKNWMLGGFHRCVCVCVCKPHPRASAASG